MGDDKYDIERYLSGKMSPGEMYALERRALTDPFLAEAIEGASSIEPGDFNDDLNALRKSLHTRTNPKGKSVWMWPLRIAAGIAILLGATFIFFRNDERRDDIALNSSSQTQLDSTSERRTQAKDAVTPSESPATESAASSNVNPSQSESIAAVPPNKLRTSDHMAARRAEATNEEARSEGETIIEESGQIVAASPEEEQVVDDVSHEEVAQQIATDPPLRMKTGPTNWLVGFVADSEDGKGLPGVNVTFKNSTVGTITDEEGRFKLPMDSLKDGLLVSFIGYESKEVIPTGREVNVTLEPDISELSEVVVVGYGGNKREDPEWDPIMELAEPNGGRKAYKSYLVENLRYPEVALNNKVEGRVTVQFTLEPTGQMTDFKIVRGLGYGCDEELIRLIKEGPKWRPTRKNTEPVADKIRVRMRFKLPKSHEK